MEKGSFSDTSRWRWLLRNNWIFEILKYENIFSSSTETKIHFLYYSNIWSLFSTVFSKSPPWSFEHDLLWNSFSNSWNWFFYRKKIIKEIYSNFPLYLTEKKRKLISTSAVAPCPLTGHAPHFGIHCFFFYLLQIPVMFNYEVVFKLQQRVFNSEFSRLLLLFLALQIIFRIRWSVSCPTERRWSSSCRLSEVGVFLNPEPSRIFILLLFFFFLCLTVRWR